MQSDPTSPDEASPTGPAPDGPILLPPALAYSEDLTWNAAQLDPGMASPFQGPAYDGVFQGLARGLHRRKHPHVLLVGERGVGKSSVAAEFARRGLRGDYRFLAETRFLLVDSRFTAPDETRRRLAAILDLVAPRPQLAVVWDGLAGLLRGAPDGGNRAALLGGLAFARCRLIVPCTPRECDEMGGDDTDLAEFFIRVDVPEPDPEAALPLMRHYAEGLGRQYDVAIDPTAVATAVTLTANYVFNDQMPAKALKALARACEVATFRRDADPSTGLPAAVVVRTEDVVRAIAAGTGIPEHTLAGVADGTDYEAALGDVIFGQENAVREVATELGLIKAGMTDPGKPASVLMFLGQTGTGKTELAKALARFYSVSKRLKTYTLGNCIEAHSVSTIIGVPPGYVGSERGGRLVADLNADPYSVFLLDEADKAHPDVLQPFLNLFDEGWVTDQRGAKGHAQKAIFVLTTNVGQRMIADMTRDGKSDEEIARRMKEALSQIRHTKSDRPVFTPEFLARIKRVIVFRPLARHAMGRIARKLFESAQRDWADRRARRLILPEALAVYLGEAAFRLDERSGGKEGGRVVRKLMAEWVEAPLQRAMAADPVGYRVCGEALVECGGYPEGELGEPYPVPELRVCFR